MRAAPITSFQSASIRRNYYSTEEEDRSQNRSQKKTLSRQTFYPKRKSRKIGALLLFSGFCLLPQNEFPMLKWVRPPSSPMP